MKPDKIRLPQAPGSTQVVQCPFRVMARICGGRARVSSPLGSGSAKAIPGRAFSARNCRSLTIAPSAHFGPRSRLAEAPRYIGRLGGRPSTRDWLAVVHAPDAGLPDRRCRGFPAHLPQPPPSPAGGHHWHRYESAPESLLGAPRFASGFSQKDSCVNSLALLLGCRERPPNQLVEPPPVTGMAAPGIKDACSGFHSLGWSDSEGVEQKVPRERRAPSGTRRG
jgi:hypothetical protein